MRRLATFVSLATSATKSRVSPACNATTLASGTGGGLVLALGVATSFKVAPDADGVTDGGKERFDTLPESFVAGARKWVQDKYIAAVNKTSAPKMAVASLLMLFPRIAQKQSLALNPSIVQYSVLTALALRP